MLLIIPLNVSALQGGHSVLLIIPRDVADLQGSRMMFVFLGQ